MKLAMIVAKDTNDGIGFEGGIPWRLPEDMAYFKQVTLQASEGKQNAVIMGRKTWESIPKKFRPLPGRINCVLSSDLTSVEGCDIKGTSLMGVLELLEEDTAVDTAFIIGGSSVYGEGLHLPQMDTLYITQLHSEFECDVLFPAEETWNNKFKLESASDIKNGQNGVDFQFEVWRAL